jgi:hypothetical protein
MRACTWMLLGLFTVALAGCGERKEPPLPDDVTTKLPDVDPGTLMEDPGSVNTTGEDSSTSNDPGSEAPPYDPDSAAPAFDPGGGEDPDDSGDPPPAGSSSTGPADDAAGLIVSADSPVVDLVAKLADPNTRDAATAVIRQQGTDAVPQLVTALEDDNWQIRAGAVFALSVLGDEAQDAVPKLRDLASTEKHEAVRDAASWAIDAIEPTP